MGMTAALKLKQIVENAEKVLAIELMTAAQGLEYRQPLKAATEIERALPACAHTRSPAGRRPGDRRRYRTLGKGDSRWRLW